ncbi:hypothetical protein DFH06DRAFT_1349086 [Mycena polygramma]|nr:hypothetical protein DFH06DRAFT_1349086 [Mycena polygramma]
MTRSASSSGTVNFSYNFPVASGSTCASALSTLRTRRKRTRTRPEPSSTASSGFDMAYADQSLRAYTFPYTPTLPHPSGSSYQRTASALSSASHGEPRRSLEYEYLLPPSSSASSLNFSSSYGDGAFPDSSATYAFDHHARAHSHSLSQRSQYSALGEHSLCDEDEEEDTDAAESSGLVAHSLRRQWAALSLRVRFGVFHAKRRMRARTL